MKTLNESDAVLITMPGIWGCQCNSLTSFCPWWTNSNWGGTAVMFPSAGPIGASSSSGSTDKSHRVSWSSEPEAAKTEESVGCHSTDVMGAVCHWN